MGILHQMQDTHFKALVTALERAAEKNSRCLSPFWYLSISTILKLSQPRQRFGVPFYLQNEKRKCYKALYFTTDEQGYS